MFCNAPVPNRTTIYKYTKKSEATGSIPDGKKTYRRHLLTVEHWDTVGATLETSP
jgi:hypothetical protein